MSGLFSGDASASAFVLILGILAGVVAQVITYLTVRFNAKQAACNAKEAAERDERRREWDVQDRMLAADDRAELKRHVTTATAGLQAAIADNTQKTEDAAYAATEAYKEANQVNDKILSLGLRTSDGAPLRYHAPCRVFVVDDNDVSLQLSRAVLLGAGYLVDIAKDAETALQCLAAPDAPKPDLYLLDLGLPGGMDGFQLSRTLRANGVESPILAHTGFAERHGWNPQEAYEAGMDGYVEKSQDLDVLPRIVAQHLRLRPKPPMRTKE